MEGFYINRTISHAGEMSSVDGTQKLNLLAKTGKLEIMRQIIATGATVWLVPGGTSSDIEFFFVHEGEIQVELDSAPVTISAGQSFYVKDLKHDVLIKTLQDTVLLYVSTMPVFDAEIGFQMELNKLIEQINDKDNYTAHHSKNVMRYSVKLYEKLKGFCPDNSVHALVLASLFHDVGKCKTPDEILKKKGPLSKDEYLLIQQHPLDSARILQSYFDETVVEIAVSHHERLDGSGYPQHLCAENISFEARLLAVADAFDAMTTNRGYNRPKTFLQSAEELCSLPHCYDSRVAQALLDLVKQGEIEPSDSPFSFSEK